MTRPAPESLRCPVPLSPDNFTPLSRTPWGGEVIGRRFKAAHVAGVAGQRIGEAWEFSCDPVFPSRVAGGAFAGSTLAALIEAHPEAVLSPAAWQRGETCNILVKLLDTAEPLSLQVHPADGDPHLTALECGKPESWLVLAAEPGAGIYLGFARPLLRAELRTALESGVGIEALLHFEPVVPGDYFEIEPGVPHAIGAGVTLLEPQRTLAGREGKTFRLWDWERRYDAAGGRAATGGALRPLHLDAGLKLLDPSRQVGPAFAQSLRRRPHNVVRGAALTVNAYPANADYQVLTGSCTTEARWQVDVQGGFGVLVVLAGDLRTQAGAVLGAGQTALLPHAAMPLTFHTTAAEFALIVPAAATVRF